MKQGSRSHKDIEIPKPPHSKEAALAEYSSISNEILQLNSQIFTVLTSGLGLNILIIGWMFTSDPFNLWYLPLVGIGLLSITNILLLNINRLAHRLAIFQKYFIEDRLPDICWARVGFAYRELYEYKGLQVLYERIAQNRFLLILLTQFVNLLLVVFFKFEPISIPIIVIVLLLGVGQWLLMKSMTNYKSIEEAFKKVEQQRVKHISITGNQTNAG